MNSKLLEIPSLRIFSRAERRAANDHGRTDINCRGHLAAAIVQGVLAYKHLAEKAE